MNAIAVTTLQTPWDCRWSRFASRRRAAGPKTLWVCTYRNSQIPILATDCDTCTCFEFQPPLDALHEDTPRCHDAAL
jgi:hypothetical protein